MRVVDWRWWAKMIVETTEARISKIEMMGQVAVSTRKSNLLLC